MTIRIGVYDSNTKLRPHFLDRCLVIYLLISRHGMFSGHGKFSITDDVRGTMNSVSRECELAG